MAPLSAGGEVEPGDGADEARWLSGRRGARFEETLWERPGDEGTDDEWLAGLRKDLGEGPPWGEAPAAPERRRSSGMDPHAGLSVSGDVLADVRRALEEVSTRLGGLERDVARVRAALVRSQTLLDRAQLAAGDLAPRGLDAGRAAKSDDHSDVT